jgi:hypothetical protein
MLLSALFNAHLNAVAPSGGGEQVPRPAGVAVSKGAFRWRTT